MAFHVTPILGSVGKLPYLVIRTFMRYRSFNHPSDLQADIVTAVGLLGRREYRALLLKLGSGLNKKGYVTPVDDLRFSLELALLNLELEFERHGGRLPGMPAALHEAADFMLGLGQTARAVSSAARDRLRGKVIGGLKTNGLRPLQHELRVAASLSNSGADVEHSDLEGGSGCDFLAKKDGVVYEVEAKTLPIYSARPIQPQDADKLFHEIRSALTRLTTQDWIPIITVQVPARLNVERNYLRAVAMACDAVAHGGDTKTMSDGTTISAVGRIPADRYDRLGIAAFSDSMHTGVDVYLPKRGPRVVVRLASTQIPDLNRKVAAVVSEASKKQLSGSRPAVVWVHFDYCPLELFQQLHTILGGVSPLDAIAQSAFASPKRLHVAQIVFSGGAFLEREAGTGRSSFGKIVYNAPHCKFQHGGVFPGGKVYRGASTTRH